MAGRFDPARARFPTGASIRWCRAGSVVTIFFFISGFLITSLLISEFQREGRISLKKFYLRRFWRLAPPLICFIVLSTLLIVLCLKAVKAVELLSAILYFANYYSIYWQYQPLPFGPSPLKILWSLAIEEHFYIVFAPLMAFFAHTRRRLFLLLLILLVMPLAIRCAVVLGEPLTVIRYEYTYMATEARIDSIAWGALLAWLCSHVGAARLKALLDNDIAVGASLGLLLLCLLVRDEGFPRIDPLLAARHGPASAFLRNRARPERPASARDARQPPRRPDRQAQLLALSVPLARTGRRRLGRRRRPHVIGALVAHVLPALDRAVVRLVPDHRTTQPGAAQEVRLACARLSETVSRRGVEAPAVRTAARPLTHFVATMRIFNNVVKILVRSRRCLSPRGNANESRSAPARNDG